MAFKISLIPSSTLPWPFRNGIVGLPSEYGSRIAASPGVAGVAGVPEADVEADSPVARGDGDETVVRLDEVGARREILRDTDPD